MALILVEHKRIGMLGRFFCYAKKLKRSECLEWVVLFYINGYILFVFWCFGVFWCILVYFGVFLFPNGSFYLLIVHLSTNIYLHLGIQLLVRHLYGVYYLDTIIYLHLRILLLVHLLGGVYYFDTRI